MNKKFMALILAGLMVAGTFGVVAAADETEGDTPAVSEETVATPDVPESETPEVSESETPEVSESETPEVSESEPAESEPETPDEPAEPSLPSAIPSFSLDVEPVEEGATDVTVNLVVTLPEDATGYELGSFGLEVSYDYASMTIAGEPEWYVEGNYIASESIYARPYRIMWVSVETAEQFTAGSTIVCQLTFNLKEAAKAGTTFTFNVVADDNNGVCTMPSKDGTYAEMTYPADMITFTAGSVTVSKKPIYGDANGDDKVTLDDVTLMLQSIAGWTGVEVNTELADVVADGDIKLDDVTLILQSIAGWDVVLGPVAE